jgi:hypothetical protein
MDCRVARLLLVQHTKTGENVPDDRKIIEITIKYTKWTEHLQTGHHIFLNLPLQDPNWDFWFETTPSGSPEFGQTLERKKILQKSF